MKRLHLALLSSILLACCWPQPATAQSALPPARTLSVFTGMFWPTDGTVDTIYGPKVPVVVQLDWRLLRHVAVFGGVDSVWGDGTAIVEGRGDSAGTPRAYDVSLQMTSFRGGAAFVLPRGFWEMSAGAAVTVNRYRERWPTASITTTGSQPGWLVQARLLRGVSRRIWFGGGVEYASIPDVQGDRALPAVDLGGARAFAGGGFRF